jgi:Ca2+-binding EF-hand superfamily protein
VILQTHLPHPKEVPTTMSSDVGAILSRIEKNVYARRIRAKDFFKDYDKLRCGRVTKPQFTRVLLTMGLNIPPSEAELLAEHFIEDGPNVSPPQIVNYLAFCNSIDECFGVLTGLESNPGIAVPHPGENVPPEFAPNPVENEEQLDHVLHRLALMCKARGLTFKYCYQDYERSDATSLTVPRRGGKITIDQFKRSFPYVKEFDAEEIDLLIDHYLTDQNLVHYGRMHEDLAEHLGADVEVPFPKSELLKRDDPHSWTHHQLHVVEKIQAYVVERRLRLREHFQDYDPLRKGFCTTAQVKTIFALLKISLEPDEFNELYQTYTKEDGLFCYAAFCAEVDQAFTLNHLEKQPLTRIEMPDHTTTIHARRNYVNLSPAQTEAIAKLEEGIKARVKTRRILIRPDFQRFDPTHTGHVTKSQFTRVMDGLGFQMDSVAIDLICLAYTDLGNHIDFNYVDFCSSCDPASADDNEAMAQENAPYKPHKPSQYFDMRGRIQPLGMQNH